MNADEFFIRHDISAYFLESHTTAQINKRIPEIKESEEHRQIDVEVQELLQHGQDNEWLGAHMENLIDVEKNNAQVRYVKENVIGRNNLGKIKAYSASTTKRQKPRCGMPRTFI